MKTFSVSGGKGGVGKTTLSINLAYAMGEMGYQILMFDADLGLANIDVLLGAKARKNLADVLAGRAGLEDTLIKLTPQISLIPAASGIQKLSELSIYETREIIESFSTLPRQYDVLLVDTAAGITQQVLQFAHAAQDILITVTHDPASLSDSYAIIKLLHQKFKCNRFGIVANMTRIEQEGLRIFEKLQTITERFLAVHLEYLGEVPFDDYMMLAARRRKPVITEFPGARSSKALKALAERLLHFRSAKGVEGNITYFIERMLQCQIT